MGARVRARIACFAAVVVFGSALAYGAEYYVATDGKAANDGSKAHPWDFASAIAAGKVKPGDTVWVAGGTYVGQFNCTLVGAAEAPIKIRAVPGERATLDCGANAKNRGTLEVDGKSAYVWFWGLEVTSSDIMRKTEQEGSFPGGVHDAVTSFGKGHKFINLIVHDGNRNGLDDANWDNSFDQEFYGCIVYYNGWQSTDRGHGHGIYMQNQSKRKTISDCIFFKQFGWGIHLYGTSNAHMENIDILNNISFDNGALAGRPSQNLLVTGGATKPTNIKVIDNCTFHSKPGDSCQISKANGVDIQGNYIGGDGININNWGKGAIQGNTFIGKFSGPTLDPEWKNVVMENPPKDAVVFVRANKYEPGERANVVVYNWAGLDSVKVDLSKSGFKPGTKVEIRDVQNYFGKPAFTGGFQKELTLPMNLTEVAAPVGKVTADPVHTPKQFNVFVILKARAK